MTEINKNSIIPAIQEGERFINFLNEKFKLELLKNFIISFHKQHKRVLGSFTPNLNPNHFEINKEKLHIITINTLHLRGNPYETLAHELAHFYNNFKEVKDCSSNQYHNKHFKRVAEMLLLRVKKVEGRGFAFTEPTEEFNKMLDKEFKKNDEVFKLFQNKEGDKEKKPSRNYLFTCVNNCYKIRCGDKSLIAVCGCGEPFQEVLK